jgi:hypothetical protein
LFCIYRTKLVSLSMTDDSLTFSCFLIGDKTPFDVRISATKTIEDLKLAINDNKEPVLDSMVPYTHKVWKATCNLPEEPDLVTAAEKALEQLGSPLRNSDYIREHFSEPLEKSIHIIVKRPGLGAWVLISEN